MLETRKKGGTMRRLACLRRVAWLLAVAVPGCTVFNDLGNAEGAAATYNTGVGSADRRMGPWTEGP
jgi:hypothetical protein